MYNCQLLEAKYLIERYGIVQISTGDMLRDAVVKGSKIGKEVKSIMEKGELVSDKIIMSLISDRIVQQDCEKGFILDGFPRTTPQAEGLDYLLKSMKEQLDHVIVMDVPDNLIITRLSNRRSCKECGQVYNLIFDPPAIAGKCNSCGEDLFLRPDDNPAIIQQRLTVYHQQTKPVIKYYSDQGLTDVIDSKGTIDEIRSNILLNITS